MLKIQNAILFGICCLGVDCLHAVDTPSYDATRALSAAQFNLKLSNSISLTKDPQGNVVSYFVNGVSPGDAEILLQKKSASLSKEFTIIMGTTEKGATCTYFLPSKICNDYVAEIIFLDLHKGGATNISITTR